MIVHKTFFIYYKLLVSKKAHIEDNEHTIYMSFLKLYYILRYIGINMVKKFNLKLVK